MAQRQGDSHFYLASWGMYRGSSFLLWKDYLIHKEIVEKILQNRDLQQLDYSSIKDVELEKVMEISTWIKDWYKNNINKVNGRTKQVNATDTLVTKIMLGTLGCVPAYDQYFIYGMRQRNIACSQFSLHSLRRIVDYYYEHKTQFDKAQNTINQNGHVRYPTMKLIDMYFWEIGFEDKNK
jgi:hypothetical protein